MEEGEGRSEAVERERGRRGGAPWLVWMLVAFVIYVLSVGPIVRYFGWTALESDFIYRPLHILCKHSYGANRCIEWYVNLWTGP